MFLFSAQGDPGERAGPQVPNHHEEPGQEIRHSGAVDGAPGHHDDEADCEIW